ncbi:hypothetical protein D3C87_1645650 [compost metagenome]
MLVALFASSFIRGLLFVYFMSATTFRSAFTYVQDISLTNEKYGGLMFPISAASSSSGFGKFNSSKFPTRRS